MAEKDEKPPTLTSLRANRRKPRVLASRPAQIDLLFAAEPPAPLPSLPQKPSPSALPTQRHIWTVRDLVIDIRQKVEVGFPDLWVEGEISNFRAASAW
jgi:hypothetical protein